jgi:parallel beta-helix repeat protein
MIKVLGADGVTFRRVRTEWTNGPDVENGAYGLYPVQCRNVLIEDSVVKGASDAGIYVGQSRNIVVRRNQVEFNVAGIEIENSTDADVYENVATNNTGGILVFNLPGPPVQDGRRTRVYDNQIVENNTPNFAEPGSSVSGVPKGTGAMVLSNDQVEIFGNTFRDNDTTHILLISYNTAEFFGQAPPNNPDFDPYSESNFVHDNTFEGGGDDPDLPELVLALIGTTPLPNIIYDGDENPALLEDGQVPDAQRLCIQQPGATFIDLDVPGGFVNVKRTLDSVDCSHAPLQPIRLDEGRSIEIGPGPDAEDELLAALLEAEPGDDILLKAGRYTLTSQLSLDDVDHVTVRGEGMDQTILDFSGLTSGGEGLLLRANDFTLRDLAFENAPGDQFKAEGCDGLRIQRVRAEWTNGPDTDNGAYGLYPVQCKDVLIEDSVVKGASDAGIYVGQSRNIIVRRNLVEFNVAGIEIENSTAADVYDNLATHNTGGILVFNLPGLPVFGDRTRVFNNDLIENNTANFAPAGNIVATVPDGTGILILANDKVEVFGNEFRDNNSAHLSAISYNTAEFLGSGPANDPSFDPFSESLYFLDNTYVGGGTLPDPDLELLVQLIGGPPIPHIVIDGDVDPDKQVAGELPGPLRTCIQESSATFVNLNIPVQPIPTPEFDLAPFDCSLSRLTPVAIAGVR